MDIISDYSQEIWRNLLVLLDKARRYDHLSLEYGGGQKITR